MTRITFVRDGAISQIVELDLEHRTPRNARRHLIVWILRMSALEPNSAFTVKIGVS